MRIIVFLIVLILVLPPIGFSSETDNLIKQQKEGKKKKRKPEIKGKGIKKQGTVP